MYSAGGAPRAMKYSTSQLLFGAPSRAWFYAVANCDSALCSRVISPRYASSHILVDPILHLGALSEPLTSRRIRFLCPRSSLLASSRFSTSIAAESSGVCTAAHVASVAGVGRRVVFLGTPEVSARTLQQLVEASHTDNAFEVVAAVTRPPAVAGRYNKQTKSPVHAYCDAHRIPVLIPEKASDPEFIAAMQKLAPDVCVTAAYGQYLPKAFLDIPRCGTVNIHPSLLPKYRGAAPVQRCLDNGDTTAGVSVLFSVKKMDAGPVLGQESVELNGNENASDLLVALFDRGTKLLLKLMPNILSGCAGTTTQDDSQATLAPKCANVESEIHLESMSASMVHNRCRALHGSQGVWTMLRSEPKQILKEIDSKSESTNSSSIANTGTNSNSSGKTDKAQATARYAEGENIRVKLIETMVIKEDPADGSSVDISPGDVSRGLDVDRSVSIVKVNKQRVLRLTCGDGSKLGVVMLQPATKRVMSASDFMNGQVGRDIYWIPFESEAEPQTTSTTSAGIIEAKKTSQ